MLLKLIIVIHCSVIFVTRAQLSEEYLAARWTFDYPEDSSIWPVDVNVTLFDATTEIELDEDEAVLETGRFGDGLKIQGEIDLVERLRKSCLDRLDLCADYGGGLTLAFWIKPIEWNSNDFQVILRTSTANKRLPGIFIGKSSTNNNIEVFFWDGGADIQYTAEFPINQGIWTHLAISWSAEDGINVAKNGTFLTPEGYSEEPRNVSRSGSTRTSVDVVMGSSFNPVFIIDDLYVFYRKVSEYEIAYLAGSAATEITTAASTSTATPTESATTINVVTTPTTVSAVATTSVTNTTKSTTPTGTPETTSTTETSTTPTTPTSTPTPTPTSTAPTGDCPIDFQEAWKEYTVNMQKWKEAFEEYQESEGEPTC